MSYGYITYRFCGTMLDTDSTDLAVFLYPSMIISFLKRKIPNVGINSRQSHSGTKLRSYKETMFSDPANSSFLSKWRKQN